MRARMILLLLCGGLFRERRFAFIFPDEIYIYMSNRGKRRGFFVLGVIIGDDELLLSPHVIVVRRSRS